MRFCDSLISDLLNYTKSIKLKMQLIKLFRTKSVSGAIDDIKEKSLRKSFGRIDLILLGIGCIIGTGIFVLTGIGAAKYAGPGIAISYFVAACACAFAGLAYAELASTIPVAGSAYTYSYIALGEFIAWLVGWGLILEYTFAASTISVGWSGYMVGILASGGIHIPDYLTKVPLDGGIINLPAVVIASFIGLLLIKGTKESVIFNRTLVAVKLSAVFIFLIVAVPHIDVVNYANFLPFGWHGVMLGASTIFFAYLGFDAVSTAAEECKNPQKDLPIGIIGSLLICTTLYIAVALVLTGIVNYKTLDNSEPLAYALRANGSNIGGALVAVGALAGMTTTLLGMMYAQSRVYFAMSRDGLIPSCFSKIHSKFQTPHISSIIVTASVILTAGFTPIYTLSHMANFGTLFAFIIVSIGVLVLRIKKPELIRHFRCPAIYFTVGAGCLVVVI